MDDRTAIHELFVRFSHALDDKRWELLDGFFADDAVGEFKMSPDAAPMVIEGGAALVDFARRMVGSPELATHHMMGNFTATIDRDTAEAQVHMRNYHGGIGPRAGLFQESIGTFRGRFARRADGWMCTWWEEVLFLSLGDAEKLFAPEIGGQRDAPA